jgi:hypothetical protein
MTITKEREDTMLQAHREGREAYKAWIAGTVFVPDYNECARDARFQEALNARAVSAGAATKEAIDCFRAGFIGEMARHNKGLWKGLKP